MGSCAEVPAGVGIVGEGGTPKGAAMKEIETARDLDVAMLERQCQEELGSLAKFWLGRLPQEASDELLQDLRSLSRLAPSPRPSA